MSLFAEFASKVDDRGSPRPPGPVADDYSFLVASDADSEIVRRAGQQAARQGVSLHRVLISHGIISADNYVRMLAEQCQLGVMSGPEIELMYATERLALGVLIGRLRSSKLPVAMVDAEGMTPSAVRRVVDRLLDDGYRVVLAPTAMLRPDRLRGGRRKIVERAVLALERWRPAFACRTGARPWQLLCGCGAAAAGTFALVAEPLLALEVLGLLVSLPILASAILRSLALLSPATRRISLGTFAADHELPSYTILVPLFREAASLPQLVRALTKLDYPVSKLDIKLVLEAIDARTIAAAQQMRLPPWFELVIVPLCPPMTKPKALNYALQLARGELLVIYDAEDIPDPDQLRLAVQHFGSRSNGIVALQAALVIDNEQENWLTRQFAIEYLVLFSALLPTYARVGVPILLGGTSNHFVTRDLKRSGGWDAFNVTEDADLGIRMARLGRGAAVLDSATCEEAPPRLAWWFRQRTRWLKGFMITYIVHTRHPLRLWRELGVVGFCGFHAVLAGAILSILVHPLVYALAIVAIALDALPRWPVTPIEGTLWGFAAINVLVGFAGTFGVAIRTLIVRRRLALLPHVVLLPCYWLLVSVAGYRALWQVLFDPFRWEKTEHGFARRRRRTAPGAARHRPPRRPAVWSFDRR